MKLGLGKENSWSPNRKAGKRLANRSGQCAIVQVTSVQLRLDKFKLTFQKHSFNAEASCSLAWIMKLLKKDRQGTNKFSIRPTQLGHVHTRSCQPGPCPHPLPPIRFRSHRPHTPAHPCSLIPTGLLPTHFSTHCTHTARAHAHQALLPTDFNLRPRRPHSPHPFPSISLRPAHAYRALFPTCFHPDHPFSCAHTLRTRLPKSAAHG